jgi:multicomponent Na+:H+ antiporter subunit D
MILLNHLPVLQVLIIFFAALFTIISSKSAARLLAIISILLSLSSGIYCWTQIRQASQVDINSDNSLDPQQVQISANRTENFVSQGLHYYFGNFRSPIGIEHTLDSVNQPLIIYINAVLLFVLIFGNKAIDSNILNHISTKRQNLFYSILLFAHTGYIGIMSTNDIFNLYVFIEIASLSTYVLVAQGSDKRATIGAFDYLILGTIGATLILIAIGFLLEFTGSLNMSDIKERLHGHYHSKIVIIGISFFLTGAILKTAFFPMHFWMLRAYLAAPTIVLVYIAGISSIIGTYIFLRFIHSTVEYSEIISGLSQFLKPLIACTMIICSLLALKAKTVKKIVIYSCTTQIGYIFLLALIPGANEILLQFLLADSLNKVALFFIISHIEIIQDYRLLLHSKIYFFLVAILLICSSALPISKMFIIKLNILDLMVKQNLWHNFIIITISSSISLLYHYKIAVYLFIGVNKLICHEYQDTDIAKEHSNSDKYQKTLAHSMLYGLSFLILMQFILLLI